LPVVSTDIPEVQVLGVCRLARDNEGYVREIEEALKDPGPRAARSEAIRHESWAARLDEIRQVLSGAGGEEQPGIVKAKEQGR
jgi:hypothetical protein